MAHGCCLQGRLRASGAVGNISLYKLQPSTTSSSPAVEPEEPCTQATGRKRRRKRKRKRQAELDGLAGSDAEMQE